MRWILNTITAFFLAGSSLYAQDVIVRKNGDTIEGKVVEVGINQVSYKISSEPTGATFVIRKSELKQIEFADGKIVFLNDRDRIKSTRPTVNYDEAFGKNMLTLSPFKVLDSGPGIGIGYERIVGKKGYFGIVLPVSLVFPDNSVILYDSNREGGSRLFYFAPGFKVYPFGQRKVTYSVGPNIFTAFGKTSRYNYVFDPATGTYNNDYSKYKNFRLGLLVTNYVNFQITQSFQIGLSGGLGARYIDRETYGSEIRDNGVMVTGEFNFNLGLRF